MSNGVELETGRWNVHHALYYEGVWESHVDLNSLRLLPGLIIPMDATVHQALHREIPYVPAFSAAFAGRLFRIVARSLAVSSNPAHQIRLFSDEIEMLAEPKHNTDWVTRSIAPVTVEALRSQIPYVREGYIPPDLQLKGRRYKL